MRVVPVAGVSFRPEAHEDPSFDPGLPVALVPEPDNEHDPNAVGIWNEQRTLQAGYVPRERGARARRRRAGRVALARRGRPARADRARPTPGSGDPDRFAAVAYEFKLPDLGEGLTEGEVARWLVAEGDEVAEDQPLVEIQTDKTTVEIPSPAAGKVAQHPRRGGQGRPGRDDPRRHRRGRRRTAVQEQPRAEPAPSATPGVRRRDRARTGRVRATPLVRRLAQELGVDLETLTGTGPQGRVTEEDVREAATSEGLTPGQGSEGRREPLRGVRRLIAEHMARAHQEVPAGHLGRGVRLLAASTSSCSCRRCSRPCAETLQGVPGAERAPRRRRDRLPRPLRPGRRSADRRGPRRPGRPQLRHGLDRGARRRGAAPRREPPARASSSPRSCAARRSRSRAPASSPVSSRRRSSITPRSRSSASAGSRSARSSVTASSRSRRPAMSRSRSTTAWSTARAQPSSVSR